MTEKNIPHFGWYLQNHKEKEEDGISKDGTIGIVYSCCGDEMTIDLIDYGRCPTCKEHCM